MTVSTPKPSSPFTPKVIKTDVDYERTLRRIDQIFQAQAGTKEGDELELLLTLVELYEQAEHVVSPPDPIEAIRFRMEQQNLSQKDLIPMIGSKSKVSEVLSGKRGLSLSMIRRLVNDLDIPAEVFLGESHQR